jgi:hypothetical protein
VVGYTADGEAREKSFTLAEGRNTLTITESDEAENSTSIVLEVGLVTPSTNVVFTSPRVSLENSYRLEYRVGESVYSEEITLPSSGTNVIVKEFGSVSVKFSILNVSDVSQLTRSEIESLTPEEFGAIPAARLAALTADQVHWVSQEQINALDDTHFRYLNNGRLSREQVLPLPLERLIHLTQAQFAWWVATPGKKGQQRNVENKQRHLSHKRYAKKLDKLHKDNWQLIWKAI